MKKKTALIFGITGQDGAYLAKFLLKKKYNYCEKNLTFSLTTIIFFFCEVKL